MTPGRTLASVVVILGWAVFVSWVVTAAAIPVKPGILTLRSVPPLQEVRIQRDVDGALRVCVEQPDGEWPCTTLADLREMGRR